ncbi:rhomboid family intramembrane serine protease [Nocardiopsis ansamitocini]|uniref:Peptidase S54 rhomboid domain-containing protein n=1 Tax=Nocardiopsis ansamitocini TaxID=1670832 RepID=A0A9W6UKR2_9ACTN|nr:rhomboid family intramembrane serine protease [Nocardiopsis ansamitocini]GLU49878.1 hypothetical protein Nans01_42290 [Nocardiopsis ansamitocini]
MSASQPPTPQVVPTCFRHPDRETYVSCRRCGRSICPDCMREAAVGFQCVECVAEGNKGVREARTTFGGKVVARPYVTWTLLGLIGAGFLLQQVNPQMTGQFSMWGAGIVLGDQWYRLITAAFLHGGITHLLFNGFALYVLGPQLENWLGHVRYLALWLVSAIGGSVLSYLVDPAQASVGASGAIFGLFGAIFVIGRRLKLDTRFIVGLLAVNLLITFVVPGISWTAHIGGLVTGALLGLVYAYLPRSGNRAGRSRDLTHGALTAAITLVLVAAAVAWTLFLRG